MNFTNIQAFDANKVFGAQPTITKGWHKLALKAIGDVKETKKGDAKGAMFTFEVVDGDCAGLTFNRWLCVQAIQSNMNWAQAQFESLMYRIAQVAGFDSINSITELFGKPFYSCLTNNERTFSVINEETGEKEDRKTTDVDFARGMTLADMILSPAEYAKKFEKPVLNDIPF